MVAASSGEAEGFGFIPRDGGGGDHFARFAAIRTDGFTSLAEGHRVTFEVTNGPNGRQTSDIQIA